MRIITRALVLLLVVGLGAVAQQAPTLDEALQKIANFKFGESREALTVVNDLVRKADNSGNADERKAAEEKLLALLKSNPSPDCVDFICRQLAIIGSEATVPVVAPMLTKDEQGADWARYALEGIPGKAVDDALLDAVTKVSGRARVGIINSLGNRKTQAAVGVLGTFVGDKDLAVASSALASLGLIGGDEAAERIAKARGDVPAELKTVADDAYLACANGFAAAGDVDRAEKIYNKLTKASEPKRLQAAAIIALAKANPAKAQDDLVDLVGSDDEYLRAVAIGLLRKDASSVAPLTQKMGKLKPDAQILVLGVLEQHGDKSALAAVNEAAKSSDESLQVAAYHALGVLGDASTVNTLLTAAVSGSDDVKKTASESLDALRGNDVDDMMLAAIAGADTSTRLELIRTLGARGARAALPALLAAATDADDTIRAKAFDALGVLAGPTELPALLDLLAKMNGNSAQPQAESAVVALSQKVPQADARAKAVLDALSAAKDEKIRASLTNVAGRIGDSSALPVLRALADQASEPMVQDAAVRALCDWTTTDTLGDLRRLAKEAKNDSHRALAFNGLIRVLRLENGPDIETKLAVYAEAVEMVKSPDDKRLVLAGLGQVADARALPLAEKFANDESVKDEAKQAIEQIKKATTK